VTAPTTTRIPSIDRARRRAAHERCSRSWSGRRAGGNVEGGKEPLTPSRKRLSWWITALLVLIVAVWYVTTKTTLLDRVVNKDITNAETVIPKAERASPASGPGQPVRPSRMPALTGRCP
jgi:hypothetical protein